jgi:hypothetical protein
MLSKCANPACSEQFRYLHEGRIFTATFDGQTAVRGADGCHETQRRVERYWLCDSCVYTMTLVISGGRVVLRPVPLPEVTSSVPRREFVAA